LRGLSSPGAAFLDRDGTINRGAPEGCGEGRERRDEVREGRGEGREGCEVREGCGEVPAHDYIKRPEELVLLPGAAAAIRRLNDAGVLAIVVTNQRGIALGRMTEHDLEDIHSELAARLEAAAGARIDAFFHCPHDLGACDCRKPQTGMFRQALERFPWIDVARSVVIGDSESDVEAGRAFGMRAVRLGVDAGDLCAAVDGLLPRAGEL
jgi:D-glycero-D-manno-heptose 1,7-bisphosphate phosphatase